MRVREGFGPKRIALKNRWSFVEICTFCDFSEFKMPRYPNFLY